MAASKAILVLSSVLLVTLFQYSDTASNLTKQIIWKFESCEFENLDKCAQIVMLFGARSLVLPQNEVEMVPHCQEEKSAVKCVSDWGKKCLKSFSRHLLVFALQGGAKNIRERCRPSETRWYLRNFNCVNSSLPLCHDCMDVLKSEVNLIKYTQERSNWLPTGCCLLDKFKTCFKKSIEPYCNDDGKKYLNWAANSYYADFIDMACSKELKDGSKTCKKLVKQMNEAAKVRDITKDPDPHSVFVPLYKLLVEFGDISEDIFKDIVKKQ